MNTSDLKKLPRPSFKNPPLIEVVAGVQFENPLDLRTLDFADIWSKFDRDKFPKYREMPPLNPILPDNCQMIDMSDLPPIRRFWFETEKQDALIQVQQDRLIYNWKRPIANFESKNCYPRYELVISDFFKYYGLFEEAVAEKKVVNSKPTFFELSYVNLIDIPANGIVDVGSVFKDISWVDSSRLLPAPEAIQHKWFFQIADLPLRLVADLSTRQKVRDGQIALQYELSVRGPVNDFSKENMREWFENAHLWITHGFVDTTTDVMHEIWGREA